MISTFKPLNLEDFLMAKATLVLSQSSNSRAACNSFRIVSFNNFEYFLGWNSNEVYFDEKEHVLEYNDLIAIGIHQSLFVLSLSSGELLIKLNLVDPFTNFEIINKNLFVFTNTSVTQLTLHGLYLYQVHLLPDHIKDYEIQDEKLLIHTFEGQDYDIKI